MAYSEALWTLLSESTCGGVASGMALRPGAWSPAGWRTCTAAVPRLPACRSMPAGRSHGACLPDFPKACMLRPAATLVMSFKAEPNRPDPVGAHEEGFFRPCPQLLGPPVRGLRRPRLLIPAFSLPTCTEFLAALVGCPSLHPLPMSKESPRERFSRWRTLLPRSEEMSHLPGMSGSRSRRRQSQSWSSRIQYALAAKSASKFWDAGRQLV
mmetsp:Transcript_21732/g.38212  ORF Transcript_21732/g.38212 Transcript_21732/m.38212 type:complete len:211 (+) Transcript_21732:858-1490(+)